ncbi:(2Fe-2S)-binding protein [Cocleimonas sp. KMM 6892]|uniref:(2Fe-2S)-binding protein n=1 Tax=unclassified Cocleimonas TaxID=2639732 RepID=UPI002DBFDB39|nr:MULTISPECIES: (2Fe-2S)-binding protein [unclassified Cocleimonas]MEB8432735.1 (2Fe-2S)-binding protein [Cocleimonas sp. KMM 6892]MEC4715594.1 (2Fe-2S)-binding protein [Cocleimonas sp. KMM 6895]MEC4744788.1 (2Fe-2S)-binding protein [Cocleimonas sp. KMM 6896]
MYVCNCNAVTVKQIKRALSEGCNGYEGICNKLGVGSCCGKCREHACEVIDEHIVEMSSLKTLTTQNTSLAASSNILAAV